MGSQPFYHRATLLFTATENVDREALEKVLRAALRKLTGAKSKQTIVINSVEVEECDGEPGDPVDLT